MRNSCCCWLHSAGSFLFLSRRPSIFFFFFKILYREKKVAVRRADARDGRMGSVGICERAEQQPRVGIYAYVYRYISTYPAATAAAVTPKFTNVTFARKLNYPRDSFLGSKVAAAVGKMKNCRIILHT